MRILAIDPGTERSAWIAYLPREKRVASGDIWANDRLLRALEGGSAEDYDAVGCEMFEARGGANPIGQSSIDTILWTGQFFHAAGVPVRLIFRRSVKLYLCGTARANDAHVRQALIDEFPRSGGGKIPQIGIKSQPGPLYGLRRDMWAALGVAVTLAAELATELDDDVPF